MLSEYDERQLLKMKEQIRKYEADDIGLRSLISDLKFLVNALESVDNTYRQSLFSQWGQLEQVYADAAYREMEFLDQFGLGLVKEAIDKLKTLITKKLPDNDEMGP